MLDSLASFRIDRATGKLTHLNTILRAKGANAAYVRFAGFTFDLITEECRDELWNASPDEFGALYLQGVWMNTPADATVPVCFNEAGLRDWLRNAPAMKPMFVDPNNLASTGGLYRGMPALGLSEAQIDTLIAYLLERK